MAVIGQSLDYEQVLTSVLNHMSCIQYLFTKSLLNYYAETSNYAKYVKLIKLNYLHFQPIYIKTEHSPT